MNNLLGITEIKELVPQRYPFLMLDRVQLGEETTELTAIKNVTTNESQFCGHFPDNPIMPGVLQLEAMYQAATIALKKSTSNSGLVILKTVKKTRFKNPVKPGDQMVIVVKISNVSEGGCDVSGSCKVNGKVSCQATFSLAYQNADDLQPKSLTSEYKSDLFDEQELVFNSSNIASFLPHRFPFHYIDNVIYNDDDSRIIGQKLFSANEPFAGYSANGAFAPNIMLLETVAQLGCVKLLSQEQHKGKLGLFLSIENAEIKRQAIPGDLITFDVTFLYFKSVMGKATGIISCGEEVIATMDIAFALVAQEA